MKVKGQGIQEWEEERVIISGISERCKAKEGVAYGCLRGVVGLSKGVNECIAPVTHTRIGDTIVR